MQNLFEMESRIAQHQAEIAAETQRLALVQAAEGNNGKSTLSRVVLALLNLTGPVFRSA